MDYKGVTGNISVIQDGENCEVDWKIDFRSISNEVGAYYWSPDFHLKDEKWYLWMYPNGWSNRGCMDFCLWRYRDFPPLRVDFSFSLKTMSGKKDSEKRYVGEFSGGIHRHDTHHFLYLSHFKERQSSYLDSGYLTVSCTIRITNSTESEGESHLYCFEAIIASSNTIFMDVTEYWIMEYLDVFL